MRKEQFESYVQKWQKETFGKANPFTKLAHLQEELKELKEDLESNSDHTRLEYADCFILLFGSAESYGLSYEDICDAIDEKMKINFTREWGEPKENGVVNHIR